MMLLVSISSLFSILSNTKMPTLRITKNSNKSLNVLMLSEWATIIDVHHHRTSLNHLNVLILHCDSAMMNSDSTHLNVLMLHRVTAGKGTLFM